MHRTLRRAPLGRAPLGRAPLGRAPLGRAAALALVLTVLTAGAAWAHPSLNPNHLPSGEAVDAVLVVPHGCNPDGGMPDDGAASPTVALDLQLIPEVTELDAREVPGWDVEQVVEDGERIVRWTATEGGTADVLELPVTVTVAGPVDEPLYLAAFQDCEQGSFRWIGTPEREAEYPAVKLTPTAGAIGTSEPEDEHLPDDDGTDDDGTDDDGTDDDGTDDDGTDDDHTGGDHADDDHADDGPGATASPSATPTPSAPTPTATPTADATTAAAAEDAGPPAAAVVAVVAVLLVLAGAGFVWARRRGERGTT